MLTNNDNGPEDRWEPITPGPKAKTESGGATRHSTPGSSDPIPSLGQPEREWTRLFRVTERISQGVGLEEILAFVYREMREVIPYNRIGVALTDRQLTTVRSHWVRSDRSVLLPKGYKAPLEGSTLMEILQTGRPRVINDLPAYMESKPQSRATRLIVREGIQSSLTCPLSVRGKPVGFIFFSSTEKNTYSNAHVGFFQQIAGQLSAALEKGRLYTALARRRGIIEKQHRTMTRELELAQRVQRSLLPTRLPEIPGIDIAFEYQPATQVGGDIIDLIPLEDGRVLVFVGDAMGHGVASALVMGAVKTALHSAVRADARPDRVLARLNKDLHDLFADHFVTAACCLVDPKKREAQLALAGHEMPYWFRALKREVVQEGRSSLPLGVKSETQYDSALLRLGEGDTLVFSTDGIFEACDTRGDEYGCERLRERIVEHCDSRSAQGICSALMGDFRTHLRGAELEDDVSLVILKV